MSVQQRACPYCGTAMAPDQRTCPNPACGNQYPFDDDGAAGVAAPAGEPAGRTDFLGTLGRYRAVLGLVGILVLVVGVGFLLFRFGMSYFETSRPPAASVPTPTAGPVAVPPLAGAPGPSPSPGTGTVISPSTGASPSPAAAVTRLKVANTDGQGANMRQRASTTAPVLRTLPDGTVVEAIGSETQVEGRSWRNVRDQGGATGWIASELLVPE